MTITLVAIICAAKLCQDVVVPTEICKPQSPMICQSTMAAGKVDDPIPMVFTWSMCQSGGLAQAQDWLATQAQYHDWHVSRVMCVPGHYVSNKRA